MVIFLAAEELVTQINTTTLAVVFTAIPLIIASLTTMIVTIRNGGKVDTNAVNTTNAVKEVKADLVKSSEKRDEALSGLSRQSTEIHGLVNGEMTRALNKIEEQNKQLMALTEAHQKNQGLIRELQELIMSKSSLQNKPKPKTKTK
jgi:hypothetical protein